MTPRQRRGRGTAAAGALAVLAVLAGCTDQGRPTAEPTSAAPTTALPTSLSPTVTPPVSPSAPPTATCALPLSTWPTPRLAAAVITAPVQLTTWRGADQMVRAGIGGLILFGGPPPADLGAQLHRLHRLAPHGWRLLVSSDEEGGGIQRLAGLTGAIPWPRDSALSGAAVVGHRAEQMGRRLHALGVDIDLAPVADLDDGPGPDSEHPDGLRSFSIDPAKASADVVAFAAGLRRAGVVAVVKHFPGLGTATGNTDMHPATTAPWSRMRGRDLLPFTAAFRSGVPAVMTSHAVVPGLGSGPVSLSRAATTTLLRGQLHFTGAVFTDSLSAVAVSATGLSVPQAAVQALKAGNDDILFGDGGTPDGSAQAFAIRDAIVAAVRSGDLARSRLVDAAGRLAALTGSEAC